MSAPEDERPQEGWLKRKVGEARGVGTIIKEKVEDVVQGGVQKTMLDVVKSTALRLADVAADIDAELKKNDSPYEVAFYRVSGNLTVVGGVTFDIHFTKSSVAKEEAEFLVLINPRTQKQLRIPRKALIGREYAQVRDPDTQEVLRVDVKKGIITL